MKEKENFVKDLKAKGISDADIDKQVQQREKELQEVNFDRNPHACSSGVETLTMPPSSRNFHDNFHCMPLRPTSTTSTRLPLRRN